MKPTQPEHDENIRFVQQLFEREYRNLYRFLLIRLNNDEDDAHDCLLQIYEIALKKANDLRKHSNLNGWLYKTARLCSRHRLSRRKQAPVTLSLDGFIDTLAYEQQLYDETEEVDEQTLETAKDSVLSILTPTERTTYELFYQKKLSIKEVAEKLGQSESAIGVRLYRIRLKLKNEISNMW